MENRDFKLKPPLQSTPKLKPSPPWKQSVAANDRQTHFLNSVRFFLKPFIPIYMCACVHRVCTVTCVHKCTQISLSSINILYVRAVNTPWSRVYVFFKVSYPQCYVNNSIYWLMKLCVDLYPPDIVYVALSSQIKYKTTTSRSSSPLCSVLSIQLQFIEAWHLKFMQFSAIPTVQKLSHDVSGISFAGQ